MYSVFAVFYILGGYRFSALDLQENLRFGRIRFAGVGELFLALGIVLMFYEKGVSGLKKSLFFILTISVLLWINMSRHVLAGILLTLILVYIFRLKFLPKSLILVLPVLGAFYYYINPITVEDESLFSRIKGLVVYGEEFSSNPLLGFGYRSLTTSTPDFYVKAHEANIKLVDLGLIGALFQYGLVALLLVCKMIKNVTPDGFKVMVYLVLSLDVLFWEPKSVIVFIILASLLYEKNTAHVD
jgi:hypothetical protein